MSDTKIDHRDAVVAHLAALVDELGAHKGKVRRDQLAALYQYASALDQSTLAAIADDLAEADDASANLAPLRDLAASLAKAPAPVARAKSKTEHPLGGGSL